MSNATAKRVVLLVDDDPEFRALMTPALEQRGLSVVEVSTGKAAMQALPRVQPNLVIIDGLLPDTTGVAWIEQQRSLGNKVPMIFVSAFWRDLQSFRRLTGELGVAAVAHKPIAPPMFAEQVLQALGPVDVPEPELDLEPEIEIIDVDDADVTEGFAELRQTYLAALPEKVGALTSALHAAFEQPADLERRAEARGLAHRLRGTAGAHGAVDVGDIAGRIEDLVVLLDEARPQEIERTWRQIDDQARLLTALVSASPADLISEATSLLTAHRGRVLIVDRDAEFRGRIVALARQQLIEVVEAEDAAQAMVQARLRPPDCAVLEMDGPGTEALARELRGLPGCEVLPLAFTSVLAPIESRVAAAHAGASLFLVKPIDGAGFQHAIDHLLSIPRRKRPRVLVVDDDSDFAAQVAAVLAPAGIATHHLADPLRILETLEEIEPDLVLLDSIMPGMNGLDVCRMLRTTPRWQDLPVLFVTVEVGVDVRLAAFKAGVDDYLAKPVMGPELLARAQVRIERAKLMRERMSTDVLTGLMLRRSFVEAAGARLAEARRHKRPLSLALVDVDRFKLINDRHGHIAGDGVLAGIGRLLACRLRAEDLRGRWGGEEFALLFAGAASDTMASVLERLRVELGQIEFRSGDGSSFHVSFSAGLADLGPDGSTLEELLAAADRRLYAAKRAGRARVMASEELGAPL